MRVGIAADHAGFEWKEELIAHLREAGHEVFDVGAHTLHSGDDYPDFVISLAEAVAAGRVDRVSQCAAAAWVPRSAPIKSQAFGQVWYMTISPPTRESRTTI